MRLSIVAWLYFTGVAIAQQAPARPELKALERYLGTWTYDGADKTPGGGPVRCESTRQWIAAGNFVESRRHCSTPRGELQQLEVYGYDAAERLYRYWGFSGPMPSIYTTPAIEDAPIRWSSTAFPGRFRCSETFSPRWSESTANCEMSTDSGSTWTVISEGKSKRTSP